MKIEFETFRGFGDHERGSLEQAAPSCWNGHVRFRKTRITIEVLDEPKAVLAARLQELWETNDNPHHWGPLKAAAKSIGYELTHQTLAIRRGEKK